MVHQIVRYIPPALRWIQMRSDGVFFGGASPRQLPRLAITVRIYHLSLSKFMIVPAAWWLLKNALDFLTDTPFRVCVLSTQYPRGISGYWLVKERDQFVRHIHTRA